MFKVWVSFPFMMMMTCAALAAVDHTVYEAAGIDGATRWQQFIHITLPLISRSTYISWILMTIFCVNDFPTIYLLTAGGPVDATTSWWCWPTAPSSRTCRPVPAWPSPS